MKKVSFRISVRALGTYENEFFVPDNTTDEEIKRMVEDAMEYSTYYDVEAGYEEVTEVTYRKKKNYGWED